MSAGDVRFTLDNGHSSALAAVRCRRIHRWRTFHNHPLCETSAHRIVIHEDDWKWGRHEHYRWREHEGRGYWNGSRWTS